MIVQEDWVLCRVFHKSRAENSGKLSPSQDMLFETAPSYTLPSTSPTNQIQPPGFTNFTSIMPPHDYQYQNQTSSLMNLLQFSRETNNNNTNNNVTQIIPKGDVGYEDGFIWDMDLEGIHHHDDVASHLDRMGFEVDNDSMVLL